MYAWLLCQVTYMAPEVFDDAPHGTLALEQKL
jgi:hypothetical protein